MSFFTFMLQMYVYLIYSDPRCPLLYTHPVINSYSKNSKRKMINKNIIELPTWQQKE